MFNRTHHLLISIMLCLTLSTAYRHIALSPIVRTQIIRSSVPHTFSMMIFGSKTVNKNRKSVQISYMNDQQQLNAPYQNDVVSKVTSGLMQNIIEGDKFDNQAISIKTKKAIQQVLRLETMTEIQRRTLIPAKAGKDLLARARTGTGKTLAFLIPAFEHLTTRPGVDVLVISPTRELASQIAAQGKDLLSFHENSNIQVVYGGTNIASDLLKFKSNKPSVLVATPGRLLDLLTNQNAFKDSFNKLKVLILDEADHLLDQGFERDLFKIMKLIPQDRQTLLFSATVPPRLKHVMSETLKKDYITIDCIKDDDEVSTETNIKVPQEVVVIPQMDRFVVGIIEVLRYSMAEAKASGQHPKIVVFYSTANLTKFMALLAQSIGMDVLQIHSRLSQPRRVKASEAFRSAKKGILFTSNVSARGVDYPDVTHVIQIGIPDNREQYIHRIGRTGRADKGGKALLVLMPHEVNFMKEVKDFDIPTNTQLTSLLEAQPSESISSKVGLTISKITRLNSEGGGYLGPHDKRDGAELTKTAGDAYRAWLGFYLQQKGRCSDSTKIDIVNRANQFASFIGFPNKPPPIEKKVLGKMGLKGISGINVKR